MKVIIVNDKEAKKDVEYKLNSVLEWLIYMIGYAIVLLLTSRLFRSLYVENFIIGFLASIIIYFLNKTVKPILITISLPLIGISLGLFYFVINVFILLLVDVILGKYFTLTGFLSPIIISIFISVMNIFMEGLIIKPIIERCKKL